MHVHKVLRFIFPDGFPLLPNPQPHEENRENEVANTHYHDCKEVWEPRISLRKKASDIGNMGSC